MRWSAPPEDVPIAQEHAFRTFSDYVDSRTGRRVAHPPTQPQAVAAAHEMETWMRTCRPD